MKEEDKYKLAISFDEERRIQQIKKHLSNNARKIERDPTCLVTMESGGLIDKKIGFMLMMVIMLLWVTRNDFLPFEL